VVIEPFPRTSSVMRFAGTWRSSARRFFERPWRICRLGVGSTAGRRARGRAPPGRRRSGADDVQLDRARSQPRTTATPSGKNNSYRTVRFQIRINSVKASGEN
jgi:hypothetical protein